MISLRELERRVDNIQGQRELLSEEVDRREEKVEVLQGKTQDIEDAQLIIQTVAQQTQEELEYQVSELVTLANESVFPDPYDMKVEFVLRRNKTEADLLFERDGNLIHPLDASGGGAVDVAAFALRVSLLSLMRPKSAPVLILDEPFRFVSRNLQGKASGLLKEISERIGIQMIIVTHEETLIEHADKVFEVDQYEDGVSFVEVVKDD